LARELAQWTSSTPTFVLVLDGLVRSIYDDPATEGCQIRQFVANFVTCVDEDMSALECWAALLMDVPMFAADLIKDVAKRFN
jgi:hypothetical protein